LWKEGQSERRQIERGGMEMERGWTRWLFFRFLAVGMAEWVDYVSPDKPDKPKSSLANSKKT
jgi:hypothetical protein